MSNQYLKGLAMTSPWRRYEDPDKYDDEGEPS